MGVCVPQKNKKIKAVQLLPEQISRYPRTAKVVIRIKNDNEKVIGRKSFNVNLTDPIKISAKLVEVSGQSFQLSYCVLPGLDPRGNNAKSCQDYCNFIQSGSSMLLTLFDGHGTDGDKVSYFCSKFIEQFYLQHFSSFTSEIEKFLVSITEECDKELRLKNFDILYSGTTCIIILINQGVIYCSSVGDSRAILGTTNPLEVLPNPSGGQREDNKKLEEVKFRRFSKSTSFVQSVQLSKDQKPEDPEELQRILSAGGRVQRLLDDRGERVGPYRVWENDSNAPGLAMSRSLGDAIGKQIGVISTPVITKHVIDKDNDFFIVVASDGVWDVMDNEDVVNFVESFRTKCRGNNLRPPKSDILPANTCIAHLVCEESRTRWFSIVEDEDVFIDDISCIVLELKKSEFSMNFVPKIGSIEMDPERFLESNAARETRIKEILTRDPRRGSLVTDRILLK